MNNSAMEMCKLFQHQNDSKKDDNELDQGWIWLNCKNGHWYDSSVFDTCPYCKEGDQDYSPQMGKKREEDEFPQRLDLSSKTCPNCGSPLYIFPHPVTFGDDDGYLCLKCHFKGYYGGTRYEGQSLWQVVNKGESQ